LVPGESSTSTLGLFAAPQCWQLDRRRSRIQFSGGLKGRTRNGPTPCCYDKTVETLLGLCPPAFVHPVALQSCDPLSAWIDWRGTPGDRETLTSDLLDVDEDGHPWVLFVSQLAWRRVPGDGTLEPPRLILSEQDVAMKGKLCRDRRLEDVGAWSCRRFPPSGGGLEFLWDVPPRGVLLGVPLGLGPLRCHPAAIAWS